MSMNAYANGRSELRTSYVEAIADRRSEDGDFTLELGNW